MLNSNIYLFAILEVSVFMNEMWEDPFIGILDNDTLHKEGEQCSDIDRYNTASNEPNRERNHHWQ